MNIPPLIKLIVIILLAVFAGLVCFGSLSLIGMKNNFPYRLGLDLRGGTHLLYGADFTAVAGDEQKDAMEAIRGVIERRVNAFGVAEPNVQPLGGDRLVVELPGVSDLDEAVRQIGITPVLDFREENPEFSLPEEGSNFDTVEMFIPTSLSGKHLKRSEIVFDPSTNAPQISLQFNDEGKRLFAELTKKNIGKPLAIFLDGQAISAPIVQDEITSGEAVITGNFTIEEARDMAGRLNAGALPAPISLLEQKNIGPSLGTDSMKKSIIAGLLGFLAVMMFMIIYYRVQGLLAVAALIIYALMALAIFRLVPVTLTLAGIAGFILSVGMAVDANILIFERAKEEIRSGIDKKNAYAIGFKRAWTAIRDSNISSLITVFILGYFGTSFIRGFAVTLGIGIILSMFTAITVTKTFLELAHGKPEEDV